MAKNKTNETEASAVAFIDSYVENEQKKEDSLRLIDLMSDWSGFGPKMWGRALSVLEATTTNMPADTKAICL